jgi:hypothetical protein
VSHLSKFGASVVVPSRQKNIKMLQNRTGFDKSVNAALGIPSKVIEKYFDQNKNGILAAEVFAQNWLNFEI